MHTRNDDVLPMTSTGNGTSTMVDVCGLEDEDDNDSDVDPPPEPDVNGSKVALFFKSEPVSIEPKDDEGDLDKEEEYPQFMPYSPSAHMCNVDLLTDVSLDFPDLPQKRCDHKSLSLDSGDLEVSREFSSMVSFLSALNQYSIKNEVN